MAENNLKGNVSLQNLQKTPYLGENYFFNKDVLPFKDEFEKMMLNVDLSEIASLNSPIMFDNGSFEENQEKLSINTKEVENNDAMFYLNVSTQGEAINVKINNDGCLIDANNYKTMEVSKTLGDVLLKSAENNKALRLDFDNEVTVILRVAKDGKLDASFIPNNHEVENYLKNNIDYLKARFTEQNIAYSNINYKPYKGRDGQQKGKQGGKNE